MERNTPRRTSPPQQVARGSSRWGRWLQHPNNRRHIGCVTAIPRSGLLEALFRYNGFIMPNHIQSPSYNARRACPQDCSFHPRKLLCGGHGPSNFVFVFVFVFYIACNIYMPSECCHHFDALHIDYEASSLLDVRYGAFVAVGASKNCHRKPTMMSVTWQGFTGGCPAPSPRCPLDILRGCTSCKQERCDHLRAMTEGSSRAPHHQHSFKIVFTPRFGGYYRRD